MKEPVTESRCPALLVHNLSHSFKKHQALDQVSFAVEPETIHGFVGPNGAGKTTTLKVITTLLKPQRGRVEVFGFDVLKDRIKVRERIGFMPDHFSMYRQMSVFEYLDFFAAAYGLRLKDRDRMIQDVLALTDMENRKNDVIQGLSRGMQQRVSLARLLVNDPRLLLLDEPASGLDPRARIELMEILRELKRMGKTIFISSHILSELADLCDSVTIIDRGRTQYSGTIRELLKLDAGLDAYELQLAAPIDDLAPALQAIDGVERVEVEESGLKAIAVFDPERATTTALLQAIIERGGVVTELRESQRQLNQVFMDLTSPGVRS